MVYRRESTHTLEQEEQQQKKTRLMSVKQSYKINVNIDDELCAKRATKFAPPLISMKIELILIFFFGNNKLHNKTNSLLPQKIR